MPRLPDRFDLWVRRARACADPARQLDYVLGAMATLPACHFLNIGSRAQPRSAVTEVEGARLLLLFSDPDRVLEVAAQAGLAAPPDDPPLITVPTPAVLAWALAAGPPPWDGLLINPGEDAAVIPWEQLQSFARAWQARDARAGTGFWVPSLTTEEEDFWQEHGL
jgi:hypothetical protein